MVPIKNKERKKPSQSPNGDSALSSRQQPAVSGLRGLVGPPNTVFSCPMTVSHTNVLGYLLLTYSSRDQSCPIHLKV